MNRKIIYILIVIFMATIVSAENIAKLYLFHGEGCPHCAREKDFLNSIKDKYGDKLQIIQYEVWHNSENKELFSKFAKAYGTEPQGVPFTVIGDKYFIGFGQNTGKEIETQIEKCIKEGCIDAGVKAGIVENNDLNNQNRDMNTLKDGNKQLNSSTTNTNQSKNEDNVLLVFVILLIGSIFGLGLIYYINQKKEKMKN